MRPSYRWSRPGLPQALGRHMCTQNGVPKRASTDGTTLATGRDSYVNHVPGNDLAGVGPRRVAPNSTPRNFRSPNSTGHGDEMAPLSRNQSGPTSPGPTKWFALHHNRSRWTECCRGSRPPKGGSKVAPGCHRSFPRRPKLASRATLLGPQALGAAAAAFGLNRCGETGWPVWRRRFNGPGGR